MDSEEIDCVRGILRTNFKHLDILDVRKLGEGMRSCAYLVNGEIVFRFPKEEPGAQDTKKELRLLPLLREHLSLRIPEFALFGQLDNHYPFVGYRLVPGEPLEEDGFLSLPAEEKEWVAGQLAEFITQLRSFPTATAQSLAVPERDFRAYYRAMYEALRERVFPLINPELQAYLSSCFEWYLGNAKHFQYDPVLLHADLSCDHLLFNQEKRELSGIIDFGDMMLGDPAYEYLYLLEECGLDFVRMVMELVKEADIPGKLEKLAFFLAADAAAYILEGLKRNSTTMSEEGIAVLQEEMEQVYIERATFVKPNPACYTVGKSEEEVCMMISRLGQVMLYVEDVERVKDFWTEKAGFLVVSEMHESNIHSYELAPSEGAQTTLVLHDRNVVEASEPELNLAMPSLMFYTEDADALYQKFQEAGITVGEKVLFPMGTIFNFADVEGNYFAVMETTN